MRDKIAHLTTVHTALDVRIYHKECKTLMKAGYAVVLIAPGKVSNSTRNTNHVRLISPASSRLQRMIFTVRDVYRIARIENASVYHFHDPELIPVGLLLKAHGKKVIYDIHEDVPRQIMNKEWIPKLFRFIISFVFERFENYAAKQFDAVVAATPFICARMLKVGCRAIDVCNYPLQAEFHVPDTDWTQKRRAVCYIGAISNIRGITEMVTAIGRTDVKLLLAGKFPSNDHREQIIKMPNWSHVEELGYLSRTDVVKILSQSLAGLVLFHPVPNHVDAIPNKLFEYMSAGIPVIASNFSSWKKILEDNDCGICVNPKDSSEIAKAIQWIANHPERAKQMGENGRKAVEERYNWEGESKKLEELYEKI